MTEEELNKIINEASINIGSLKNVLYKLIWGDKSKSPILYNELGKPKQLAIAMMFNEAFNLDNTIKSYKVTFIDGASAVNTLGTDQ